MYLALVNVISAATISASLPLLISRAGNVMLWAVAARRTLEWFLGINYDPFSLTFSLAQIEQNTCHFLYSTYS